MDDWLEAAYEDRYEPYWDDAEEFERNQLALDADLDSDVEDDYDEGYDLDDIDDPA